MEFLKYDLKNKTISQTRFDRNVVAKTESIFSLGNGYLGIRSADEEITTYNKEDFFVNGIFNKDNKNEVSELANLADTLSTSITFNHQVFEVNENDSYLKTLHLHDGVLTREVTAERKGEKYQLNFERFVSQVDDNVYGQKISIKILENQNKKTNVVIRAGINGQVTNNGTQHFGEGLKSRPTNQSLQMFQKTTFSKRLVIHNMVTRLFVNGKMVEANGDDYQIDIKRRQIYFKINLNLKQGDEVVLEKLMSVHTSVDSNHVLKAEAVEENAKNKLQELLKTNYQELKNASIQAMKKVFSNTFYVKIEGGEQAQYDSLALDFTIFHLNNFVPKKYSNMNVGAKGLSGEGYQGHTYWDTEFFINPIYLFNNPKIVRNLLTYRYKGIDGARKKALEIKERFQESNLEGAQFPWEMAWPTEGEVCPYWGQADVVTGVQVPIASRRQEIHVSADVAYAVNQYYKITNDERFMKSMGYEMIIDTGYFYTNRAEKQKDGSYEIKDVMGPNEYKGNIDNNAYINYLAKFNIDLALKYINKLKKHSPEILERILSKIPYKINVSKMKEVSQLLKQQLPNQELIIAENDQFLALPKIDVSPFKMLGDAGKKLFSTQEGHKRLCSQLVKQADVVLLLNIFPELFDKEVRVANFNYYEEITTHDSSLSPATYALEAVRLKMLDKAYSLFKYGINIDLGTNMSSSNAGIHAGSLAAIYQMIVFGFGGLDWHNDNLHLDPLLPKEWSSLTYRFQYQNSEFEVSVNQNEFSIFALESFEPRKIIIQGKERLIGHKIQKFEVKHD
ncbi:glycosyl hydrolase family 65 protein [Mycoplasmopsis gallopavonis]|uniref:Maltose phosphorylase domain-containing protein n=1 Tax=Mycoplasmopsis gallopavonis TaxID=76629 RepID=A0A449B0M7_9BACT|nr:glycosyl hydrolase family 65 protein [Mycoplasmopsis gallopavonis]RIV16996.1 glycoside hydrolase family 65 protein [Mycoplasmopsis gallopavonis]VEU73299.1 maltose phosphorylase domain-containing protein [Mycoplasmopsis gallopavonis]